MRWPLPPEALRRRRRLRRRTPRAPRVSGAAKRLASAARSAGALRLEPHPGSWRASSVSPGTGGELSAAPASCCAPRYSRACRTALMARLSRASRPRPVVGLRRRVVLTCPLGRPCPRAPRARGARRSIWGSRGPRFQRVGKQCAQVPGQVAHTRPPASLPRAPPPMGRRCLPLRPRFGLRCHLGLSRRCLLRCRLRPLPRWKVSGLAVGARAGECIAAAGHGLRAGRRASPTALVPLAADPGAASLSVVARGLRGRLG